MIIVANGKHAIKRFSPPHHPAQRKLSFKMMLVVTYKFLFLFSRRTEASPKVADLPVISSCSPNQHNSLLPDFLCLNSLLIFTANRTRARQEKPFFKKGYKYFTSLSKAYKEGSSNEL